MGEPTELEPEFNEAVAGLPKTDFANYLQQTFDEQTTRDVLKIFQQIGLPAPEKEAEYLPGKEGGIVFSNRYGITIRIEHKDLKNSPSGEGSDRINDSPWIIRPLASLEAGKAVVEICPGTSPLDDRMESDYLREQLRKEGIKFWDEGPQNIGRIPVADTDRFPEGIPVVIDRGAVNYMTARRKETLTAEDIQEAEEAEKAEQQLYGPLCQSFVKAWEGRQGMQPFWDLCRSYVQEGKLVAGWNEKHDEDFLTIKNVAAPQKAQAYENRLRLADKPVSSTAPAVPRLPCRPV